MGMFDYIVCKMELPGTPPFFATPTHQFQSKDLDCEMAIYEIRENGELWKVRGGWGDVEPTIIPHHGTLAFYDSNCVASGYGVYCTPNGEDFESVDYEARFTNGIVTKIVETGREREAALPSGSFALADKTITTEDVPIDESEPEIGTGMFVQYGGGSQGFPATLVAKSDREFVLLRDNQEFEVMSRSFLWHLLFHSQEDSEALNGSRKSLWDRKAEFLQGLLQKRKEGMTADPAQGTEKANSGI